MQPNMMTSIASQGLPPSSGRQRASTATYGGVLLAEPIPAGWNPCRYSCHSPDAPPQAGTSAPPPAARRAAASAPPPARSMVSPRNSSTPGLVRIRCANPLSTSSESSSVGSSVAWWLPAVSIWVETSTALLAANSATSRAADRPGAGRRGGGCTRRAGRAPGGAGRRAAAAGGRAPSRTPANSSRAARGPLGQQEEQRAQRATCARLPASAESSARRAGCPAA